MKTQRQFILGFVLVLASLNLTAAEKIMYKWTDDKGEIHYTERAPKGIEYTRIRTVVDTSQPASNNLPTAAEQAKEKEKDNTYGTWRQENCTIANQNLDILQNAARISVSDGQGGKQLMSDQQKQEKISQMEKQRDKYCDPANDG